MRLIRPLTAEFAWPLRTLSSTRMADVFNDFEQVMDSFSRTPSARSQVFQPSCDVIESKEHFLVSFDIPGVQKEDIKIQLEGNELLISGERPPLIFDTNELAALHSERAHGRFQRAFKLPASIAVDRIEARYENGVLSLALPKAEAAKGRTIEIKTGQDDFFSQLRSSKKDMKDIEHP